MGTKTVVCCDREHFRWGVDDFSEIATSLRAETLELNLRCLTHTGRCRSLHRLLKKAVAEVLKITRFLEAKTKEELLFMDTRDMRGLLRGRAAGVQGRTCFSGDVLKRTEFGIYRGMSAEG